jgi:hypothetical protein
MLRAVWSPNGFHVINVLSKGIEFNGGHYITDALIPLAGWRKTHVGRTVRKLIVHADKAGHHCAKMILGFLEQNGMRQTPHPPCSPDLAPSDFYLLANVKQFLALHGFTDRGALLGAVQDILRDIEKVTLDWVFLAWVETRAIYYNQWLLC